MSKVRSFGWLRDLPDVRDLSPAHGTIRAMLGKVRTMRPSAADLPKKCDLREWCSPIEDQGELGSCTANAGVALVEYYQRRAMGEHVDASRLFLYKVTRNLMGVTGDTGAYLRTTMKAIAMIGVVPESQCAYDVDRFDDEPSAFQYAYAQRYRGASYYRLDGVASAPKALVDDIRLFLASQLPCMFGFTVYNTGNDAGEFPFPTKGDRVLGGHAVAAVGYDDSRRIGPHEGAFMIRNSWGTSWGEHGYGWLPYEYVLQGLAADFWSLFRMEYVDEGRFG